MSRVYILYNPLSGSKNGISEAEKVATCFADKEIVYQNIIEVNDYITLLSRLTPEDAIVICGGDGTLNRYINATAELNIGNSVYYYATGSGNDFLHDLGMKKGAAPFPLSKYIENLPTVVLNGKTFTFLNGIGYGLDGYVCDEGNKLRALSNKPINYTKIAIMGLLFRYRRTKAKVIVDGVTKEYNKVWFASAMNGRFYGGGMMLAPSQNRLSNDKLSLVVAHDLSKFRLLTIFPSVFKGNHVKYKKYIDVIEAKHIKVEYDSAVSAQIDGETVTNVRSYEAYTYDSVPKKQEELINE
jgi:diacylglycerol kinase family enzyme